MHADDREFQQRMERIETLLAEAQGHADPKVRAHVQEIVQGLLDLHGLALERILDGVAELGEPGLAKIDSLSSDDLVGNVLLLYGLHPLDLDTRVRQALDDVQPFVRSHGGEIELLRIVGGAIRLRVRANGDSCPSTAKTLKTAIEDAIFSKAPDVTSIEIDGLSAVDDLHERNGHSRFALPIV